MTGGFPLVTCGCWCLEAAVPTLQGRETVLAQVAVLPRQEPGSGGNVGHTTLHQLQAHVSDGRGGQVRLQRRMGWKPIRHPGRPLRGVGALAGQAEGGGGGAGGSGDAVGAPPRQCCTGGPSYGRRRRGAHSAAVGSVAAGNGPSRREGIRRTAAEVHCTDDCQVPHLNSQP